MSWYIGALLLPAGSSARVTQVAGLAAVAATPQARATQTFAYSAVNVAATTEGKVTQVFAYALVKP